MSARDVMVIILSIVSILFFAVLSFAICRRCSAYYDEAICKWYIKIPRTFCATLISFDQHVNAKLQPVWVSQYNRQKMSLIGFVAYILIFSVSYNLRILLCICSAVSLWAGSGNIQRA